MTDPALLCPYGCDCEVASSQHWLSRCPSCGRHTEAPTLARAAYARGLAAGRAGAWEQGHSAGMLDASCQVSPETENPYVLSASEVEVE